MPHLCAVAGVVKPFDWRFTETTSLVCGNDAEDGFDPKVQNRWDCN